MKNHSGNIKLREICREKKVEYTKANWNGKTAIKKEIVSMIQSLNPPGRFLTQRLDGNNKSDGTWSVSTNYSAESKVGQIILGLKLK